MDIREFYDRTGGDFEAAMKRLMKETRVEKFVRMFPDDPSYRELESNLALNNVKEAFRAAHTLKGVCMNLSFTKLYRSVNEVTESLRSADPDKAEIPFHKNLFRVSIAFHRVFLERPVIQC